MNIIDFAKAAGVSTATISRAFHEPDKVRPQTRDRILALASRMAYYPDPSGRALVTGRHDALGVVWPLEVEGSAAPFAQRFLAALTEVLVRLDLDLLICPINRRVPATLAHARRTLLRSRCDAWVLLYPRRDDAELLAALGTSRKPVVCLMGSVPTRPDWRCIQLRQHGWMEDALRRLHRAGARHVMFLGSRPGDQDHEERAAAFRELAPHYFSHEYSGNGADSSWRYEQIWPADPGNIAQLLQQGTVPGRISEQAIETYLIREDQAVTARRLGLPPHTEADTFLSRDSGEPQRHTPPDAIIAVDDGVALAAIKACRAIGIAVGTSGPQSVQIIGMDDTPEARISIPTLATYRQPMARMAAAAVELAMGKLHTAPTFEPEYVPGESVRDDAQ